jgi:integrase
MARREGIDVRLTANGEKRYRAEVWDVRTGAKIRKTFTSLQAARQWRHHAVGAVKRGELRPAVMTPTLRQAAEDLIERMRSGAILARGGRRFKPSVIRSYDQALRLHVLPDLGEARLADITVRDLHALVGRRRTDGLAPSTIRNVIAPLRVVYRRAQLDGTAWSNPTRGLELPASTTRRDRIADPTEAARLIAALPRVDDQALWASAFYAGLRLGELRGLRWSDIDLDAGVIRVRRGWDPVEGEIAPKTAKGRRTVPVAGILRRHLEDHWLRGGDGVLVFGDGRAFGPHGVSGPARKAWTAAGLEPITLHECRHTAASFAIAAGVNAKSLSVYMGHANIAITFDLYGHLMPGNEAETAGLLDAYLTQSA